MKRQTTDLTRERRRVETPWGCADFETIIADGIISYSTPSHGGIKLSETRQREFEQVFSPDVFKPFAGAGWLEEDCDCCLAMLVWPDLFDAYAVRGAVKTVAGWWGEKTHPQLSQWLRNSNGGRICSLIAETWEKENAELWERGGGSSYGRRQWLADLTRVRDGARITRLFEDYPERQLYTQAQLEAESKPGLGPTLPLVAATLGAGGPSVAPYVPREFDESQCGGVYDGCGIVSDADPGL